MQDQRKSIRGHKCKYPFGDFQEIQSKVISST